MRKREKETKRTDQINVALPALPPAFFFLTPAPHQMSKKKKKSPQKSPGIGRLPPLPPQSLPGLAEPSPDVSASPPRPPRPRPTLPSTPARPDLGQPGAPRRASSGPRAGRIGAGPERAARVPGLREPVLASAPAEGSGRRLPVPVRPLPRTGGGVTSGAHVRRGARPLSREGGRGSRGGGWGPGKL